MFYIILADYAWGREGLDTIVTQLLNQMDNTGPPPLEKEKIDEIPKCDITQGQVDLKLQCSVCWEDFQLSEKVRQLPCSVRILELFLALFEFYSLFLAHLS